MKRMLCAVLVALTSLAFAAETMKIDFRYRLNGDDGKNHLNWQTKTTKDKQAKTTNPNSVADRQIKDKYDATTGASKNMSTKYMREAAFSGSNMIMPKGLYCLLLFAVSSAELAETDMFKVEKQPSKEKALSISFIHRGNAYRISTDEKGQLDTLTSFTAAVSLADNTGKEFAIKKEFLKEGAAPKEENAAPVTDWTLVDWDKVVFQPDAYDEMSDKVWQGTLKTKLKDGVLTVWGKLEKADKPKKPEPPAEEVPPLEENGTSTTEPGGDTGDADATKLPPSGDAPTPPLKG